MSFFQVSRIWRLLLSMTGGWGQDQHTEALSTAIRDEPHLSYIFKSVCTKLEEAKVLCNVDLPVARELDLGPQSHVLYSASWCRQTKWLSHCALEHICLEPRLGTTWDPKHTYIPANSDSKASHDNTSNRLHSPGELLLQPLHTSGRKRPGQPTWLPRAFSSVRWALEISCVYCLYVCIGINTPKPKLFKDKL